MLNVQYIEQINTVLFLACSVDKDTHVLKPNISKIQGLCHCAQNL